MTTRRATFFFITVVAVCCITFWVFKSVREHKVADASLTKTQQINEIFFPISTIQPTFGGMHMLEIELEGRKFNVGLDLGFTGEASVVAKIVEELKDKRFIKTSTIYGARGNKHQESLYQIPKLHIGSLTFSPITLAEENEQMREEGIVRGLDPRFSITPPLGKIGWELFRASVLFLDLGHSKIAIGDTVGTFQKRGYSFESFTKVPLLSDRGLVEIETQTCKGPLRCFLDTGCAFNFIHAENTTKEPSAKMVHGKISMGEEGSLKSPIFQIGEKDVGAIVFHPFPIRSLVPIEAILGMEFFSQHQVLIDFKNQEVYISSSTD